MTISPAQRGEAPAPPDSLASLPIQSGAFPLPARAPQLAACLLTGIVYLVSQILVTKSIVDGVFSTNFRLLLTEVFHARRMIVTGTLYASAIAAAPWVLRAWPDHSGLRASLSAFLWATNFITGVAAYGLFHFLLRMYRLGRGIPVDVWSMGSPAMRFTFGVSRRVGLLSSFYIGLALTSLLFSVLPLQGLVILYSVVSASIALAALVVPPLPVYRKFIAAKRAALSDLDDQMQRVYAEALSHLMSGDTRADYERLEILLRVRARINDADVWPNRMKSIITTAWVLIFATFPSVLQVFLERWIK